MYNREIIYEGSNLKISVMKRIRSNQIEDCQVKDFLERIPSQDKKKIWNLIKKLGNRGFIRNRQKFRDIKGKGFKNFYELKSKPFRIFALYLEDQRELILLEGLKKEKGKLPHSTYNRIYEKYKEVL